MAEIQHTLYTDSSAADADWLTTLGSHESCRDTDAQGLSRPSGVRLGLRAKGQADTSKNSIHTLPLLLCPDAREMRCRRIPGGTETRKSLVSRFLVPASAFAPAQDRQAGATGGMTKLLKKLLLNAT